MEYAEKRKLEKLEERVCRCCGKKWLVRPRKHKGTKIAKRVLCDECTHNLTVIEKQKYYREGQTKYHVENRVCINCGKEWTVVARNSKSTTKVQHFCPDCLKILTVNQRRNIRRAKDAIYAEKLRQTKRDSHKRCIRHNMWLRAKQRAKKCNIEFNIDETDIIIPEICPILEVPIVLGSKGNYEYTPSLDRIDNSKGYIKGNIWVISKKANSMKNSASNKELSLFIKNILRYSLNNDEKEIIDSEDKEPQR